MNGCGRERLHLWSNGGAKWCRNGKVLLWKESAAPKPVSLWLRLQISQGGALAHWDSVPTAVNLPVMVTARLKHEIQMHSYSNASSSTSSDCSISDSLILLSPWQNGMQNPMHWVPRFGMQWWCGKVKMWDRLLQMHEMYIQTIILYQDVAHKGHAKDANHHSKALLWNLDSSKGSWAAGLSLSEGVGS